MAGRPPIELTLEQQALVAVSRALKSEADGKYLRKELVRQLRVTAAPPIRDAKAAILATPSHGNTIGPSIRQEIAKRIKPVVRTSGTLTGVSIRVSKTTNVRGFTMAARRFNRPQFRRQVYGRGVWVVQRGNPQWFDEAVQGHRQEFHDDVVAVVQRLADELAIRAQAAARS